MGYLMSNGKPVEAESDHMEVLGEQYAVDRLSPGDTPQQPMKVLRLRVCGFREAGDIVKQYAAGTNLVSYTGEHAVPGEFGEAPFYRITLVSDDMARDFKAGYELDGCEGRMLTLAEAAERTGTTKQAIMSRIERGRMPGEMVCGTWRVLDASLMLWEPER